ncbi:protein sel-1 homolog 3-like [Anguilla anguilla]|uniref:protein sel-1 homolog 3-like n=1 Tax=Anguilla anguilla TaxID=7936 RepID=UPI0015B2A5EF|nr:protein sel-1 homolog 3-like [Anguilla anguilla]
MKVSASFRFITSVAFAVGVVSLAQSSSTSRATPTPQDPGRVRREDFVRFGNAPDVVIDGYVLSVLYRCSRPCVVHVEVLASSALRTGVTIFRKSWTRRKQMDTPRTHPLVLRFPDAVAYRRDYFNRHTVDASDVMLRAWLSHLEGPEEGEGGLHGNGSYHQARARAFRLLGSVPPPLRPVKKHDKCPSWGAELLWQLTSQTQARRCVTESGLVGLLKFPLASTGERFGVIHKFYPFINKDLEHVRLGAASNPRVSFSVWIYLLRWCSSDLCGILHHVDFNNTFGTPLILLTDKGHIVFQVRLTSGVDQAFKSYTALPMRTWHRLDCYIEGSKVQLEVSSVGNKRIKRYSFHFHSAIHFNDTDGYFVIGGDKNMPGISGYFGPIRYHRMEAKKVMNPLYPDWTVTQLGETHRTCEDTRTAVAAFLHALKENEKVTNSRTCQSFYSEMRIRMGSPTCRSAAWSQKAQELYRPLLEVLHAAGPKFLSHLSGLGVRQGTLRLGERVFELVLRRLNRGDPPDFGRVPDLLPLLRLSSCLRHHRAAYLLAVIHLAGLGTPTDTLQGRVYSLMAAQGDERLALMHLGYKHMQGIDGFPKDPRMAYSYYANLGKQTCADRWTVQTTKQYPTEHVLLNDDDALQDQMDQTDDVFLYLQFQADRGDIDSQKALARILFWGQRGVSKDVGTAVKWFAKIAMETKDALSMYDYAIILFKGHGVKKNTTLGLKLMEKAASMGLLEAVNGMGWYYSNFMADTNTAVRYFEKAAANGSKDGVFNLGLIHLHGDYPGKPGKNETAAFQFFRRAAMLGHFDAAVMAAWYYATGSLDGVPRDPEKAVRMLKMVSEKNGYLGYVVRTGLRAYLRGSRQEALLSYTVAAETGFGVAQNNAAHLCEEVEPSSRCKWRYHNQSTYNHLPHHTGFLKMGDYYLHGLGDQPQDVKMAASMYSKAGLAGSAQAIYNLAVLLEEGHPVPLEFLERLNVSSRRGREDDEVLEKLYQRCREMEEDLDVSPCSLALFRVQLKQTWRTFFHHPLQCLLGYVIGTAAMAAVVNIVLQIFSDRAYTASPRRRSPIIRDTDREAEPSPANHDEVTRNGRLGLVGQLMISRQTQQIVGDWSFTVVGIGLCTMSTILMIQLS